MYLLDTHVLLWWLENNSTVSPQAFKIIQDPQQVIWVSSVTVWEIVIKKSLGKLECPDNLIEVIGQSGFKELPVNFEHIEHLKDLPHHHSDPFDRLLISQALAENLTLITRDQKIPLYTVPTLKA
jgi:PIN domain nuclease of toxin-antitoxin system